MIEDKIKRNICNCCKKKLYEGNMEKALDFRGHQKFTRYGKGVWICFNCIGRGKTARVY